MSVWGGSGLTVLFTQNLTGLPGLSFCKTFAKTDASPLWQCSRQGRPLQGCASRGFLPQPSQSSASSTSLSCAPAAFGRKRDLLLPVIGFQDQPGGFHCLAPLAALLSNTWIASQPAQPSSSVCHTEGEFQEPRGAWSGKNQRRLRS